MPGCSVLGCRNRSEKGFRMNKAPNKPGRRELWENYLIQNGRTRDISSVFFICEVHFDRSISNDPIKHKDDWIAEVSY